MRHCRKIIHEKNSSIPIPIPNNSLKETILRNYDLNAQIFDPTQYSPPNPFMLKLNKRIEEYYKVEIKSNNCVRT